MNNKEFQKKQQPKEPQILPGNPRKIAKKHRQPGDYSHIWNFLSDAANPAQIITVISMFIFGFSGLPQYPAILCIITSILFLIRSYVKRNFEFLSLIWLFNSTIWILNFIVNKVL